MDDWQMYEWCRCCLNEWPGYEEMERLNETWVYDERLEWMQV